MAALAFRYVCGLRRQWRSWVLLSIVCGLAAALPIAVAANTRRTESALPRLLHQHHAPVAMVSADASQVGQAAAVQFLAEVGALPDVASRSRYAAVFLSLMTDDGSIDQRLQIGDAAGKVLDQAAMDDDGAFRLLHGRLPDPERADEVVANPEFLALTGWKVDDTVSSLRLYRFTDMDDGEPIPTKGTQLHLTIVGEVRRPEDYIMERADRIPQLYFVPAFSTLYPDAPYYINDYYRLTGGDANVDEFHRQVAAVWAKYTENPLYFVTVRDGVDATQRALRPQTIASWLMLAVLGIAALLISGQVIGRRILADNRDLSELHALGMTRFGLWRLCVFQGATIAAVGAVVAVALALVSSLVTPLGATHSIEPSTGLRLDLPVLGLGLATAIVMLTLASAVQSWRLVKAASATPAQQTDQEARERPSHILGSLVRVGAGPAALTGSRFALQPGRGRSATPVRGVLVSAGFAIGVLTAVVAFNTDLDHLIETPRLHGWDWDVAVINGFGSIPDEAVTALSDRPEVADLSAMTIGSLTIAGVSVPSVGIDLKEGTVFPTLDGGRIAVTDNEIVLGKLTLQDTGKSIGDQIDVGTESGVRPMTIVGVAIFPSIGSTRFSETSLGRGAAVVVDNLSAPEDDLGGHYGGVLMRLDPSLDRDASIASLRAFLAEQGCSDANCLVEDQRPRALQGYTTFDDLSIPFVIALVLLFAISLAHGVLSTVAARRRELWILSAIGFRRRQIDAVVLWQTMTTGIVSLVAGIAVGLVGAQIGWRVFTEQFGIDTGTSSPALRLLFVCLVTLALAGAIGTLAIPTTRRRASRSEREPNARL